MNILWLSGRRMGKDLASSTEYSLCNNLEKLGARVNLISPGEVYDQDFSHTSVKDYEFPGLTSISGGFFSKRLLETMSLEEIDVIIVDWRYILPMKRVLKASSTPWAIIDRGPPVRRGALNRLQKWYWLKSWNFAMKSADIGFVVSERHGDFVKAITDYSKDLEVIPAGSECNPYLQEREREFDKLRFVYAGQLDKRRGVEGIVQLSKNLTKSGKEHEVTICGKGDMADYFGEINRDHASISFLGHITQNRVQRVMSESHIGIMPMPDIPVWRISSTLKLAEYLASGLMIVGPDHPGNKIKGFNQAFILDKEDWSSNCVDRISNLSRKEWVNASNVAINASKQLSWLNISKKLLNVLKRL